MILAMACALHGLALLSLVGACVALLLPARVVGRLTLSPVLGLCLLAVGSPLLFALRVPLAAQWWLFAAVAGLGLVLLLPRLVHVARDREARRRAVVTPAVWTLTVAVAALPSALAGEQYSTWQGNIWDHFNYTTLGVLYAKSDPAALSASSPEQVNYANLGVLNARSAPDEPDGARPFDVGVFRKNPLLVWQRFGAWRPSVTLVFALLSQPGLRLGLPPFELAQGFLVLLLSLQVVGFAVLLRNLGWASGLAPAAGGLFAVGFWGQYLLDTNAWSQLAGLALVLPILALGVVHGPGLAEAGPGRVRLAAVLCLCQAAAIYLYPEMLVVYAPLQAAVLVHERWRGRLPAAALRAHLAAAATAVAMALPCARATLLVPFRHLVRHADPHTLVEWARYFHGFAFGPGGLEAVSQPGRGVGALVVAGANAVSSALGLYHLACPVDAPWTRASVHVTALLAMAVVLAWRAVRASGGRVAWLRTALAVGLGLAGLMWVGRYLYAAGKAYVWLSPLTFVFLLLPLALARGRGTVLQRAPALAYLLAQGAFALMRAWGVTSSGGAGIPFAAPYPSDADPSRKLTYDLRLSEQVERAAGCRLVLVDVADPFLRHYAAVSLFARDIRHVVRQELNTYFDSEAPLGFQVPPVPPDCRLRVAPGPPGARQGFRLVSLEGTPAEASSRPASGAPAGRAATDDFDGDGRSDPFVFAPPGSWYTRRSGDASVEKLRLGGASALPVPADYDGDGESDPAVFERGRWQIRLSSSRQNAEASFGGAGYLPVPADYDGDGRADLAVFHGTTGLWYVRPSSTLHSYSLAFGGGADQALPADYDGDGKADLAVRYAASGLWYVRPSSGGPVLTVAQRGGSALPVPGDYDGDGQVDIAVYEPPTGLWYVRSSSTPTSVATGFGAPGDRPAPGDYDGDGRADLAVCDPAGRWSIRYSSTLARLRFQFRSGPREH